MKNICQEVIDLGKETTERIEALEEALKAKDEEIEKLICSVEITSKVKEATIESLTKENERLREALKSWGAWHVPQTKTDVDSSKVIVKPPVLIRENQDKEK